jgi:hypothetical protein
MRGLEGQILDSRKDGLTVSQLVRPGFDKTAIADVIRTSPGVYASKCRSAKDGLWCFDDDSKALLFQRLQPALRVL